MYFLNHLIFLILIWSRYWEKALPIPAAIQTRPEATKIAESRLKGKRAAHIRLLQRILDAQERGAAAVVVSGVSVEVQHAREDGELGGVRTGSSRLLPQKHATKHQTMDD